MAELEGTPRWVKAAAIVVLAVVLVVVVLLVTGRGGSHSPSRHAGEIALDGRAGP